MNQCKERTFLSADKSYGVVLKSVALEVILVECRKSKKTETGGILIGKYSDDHNCALVYEISGPPRDSIRSATSFERGNQGLKDLLSGRFKDPGYYYLGEWHFHPFSSPEPSGRDLSQIKDIATSALYKCPEPILLIIGGDPDEEWTVTANVFVAGNIIRLQEG
ncbi:MAG TPA: Mov34/MPN/PAD-1 family protein [Pseudobdellovibrionaceae bacterium]